MKEGLLTLLVLLLILLAVFSFTVWEREQAVQQAGPEIETYEEYEQNEAALTSRDFTVGATDPKIRILMYSDGDCPFCQAFEPKLDHLLKTYPTDIAVTYRHFKLPKYPASRYEHIVLECVGILAGAQQYRSFQNEVVLTASLLGNTDPLNTAVQSALPYVGEEDRPALLRCANDPTTEERVLEKVASGKALGVQNTPTYILIKANGSYERYVGNKPYETVLAQINTLLSPDTLQK